MTSIVTVNLKARCKKDTPIFQKSGAGEESRTLDLNLGKVALYQLSYSRIELLHLTTLLPFPSSNKKEALDLSTRGFPRNPGAGEESRTLDLNLGKVALYQLSYSRINNKRAL